MPAGRAALMGKRLSTTRWLGVGLALVGVWVVMARGDLSQLTPSAGWV